jgi:serine/threonine-protein kinase
MNQLLSPPSGLGIPDAYFNNLVNEVFYTKYQKYGDGANADIRRCSVTKAWHNTAEDLLDKLEQAQLSATARRQ